MELLVTISIVALFAALAIPGFEKAQKWVQRSGCTSNMRQVSAAFLLYAADNDQKLPGRVTGKGPDGQPLNKWPLLLFDYLHNYRVYIDPGDMKANAVRLTDLLSNSANRGSFFFNGFNDLGALNDQTIQVNLNTLTDRSSVLLLGLKKRGDSSFYLDILEGPSGNQNDILNKTAYSNGSVYTFCDGSARFIPLSQYEDSLWLANKDYVIPKM